MPALNVWVPCYDDLDQLKKALASTEKYADEIDVYVVDGRYAAFEGDDPLTPGAKAHCNQYDHVEYTHPPAVPIGDPEADELVRSPQHEQAKFVNYELLPEGEWALEMDTDERLEYLDLDTLADLNPRRKYTPQVLTQDGEQLMPAIRLYQPQHWTFWIDDVMFWREYYPRSLSVDRLFSAHMGTAHRNTGYAGETEAITLRNYGDERGDEYQERRAQHLEAMGTPWAARAVREGERPSLVDLQDYAEEGEEAFDL